MIDRGVVGLRVYQCEKPTGRDRKRRRELEAELDSGAGASTDVLLTEVDCC